MRKEQLQLDLCHISLENVRSNKYFRIKVGFEPATEEFLIHYVSHRVICIELHRVKMVFRLEELLL